MEVTVYALYFEEDDSFYFGMTKDTERRYREHGWVLIQTGIITSHV